jgi:hypothetical protein
LSLTHIPGSDPTTPNAKTRYVVSTLLIPKQHATSDTCTMDEEEGVLGFTEERGLITLGWVSIRFFFVFLSLGASEWPASSPFLLGLSSSLRVPTRAGCLT